MKKIIIGISLALILIYVLGAFFLSYSQVKDKTKISQEVETSFTKDQVETSITLENKGEERADLTAVLASFKNKSALMPVYFYFDSNYPTLLTSANAYLGLYNFLTSDFADKNLGSELKIINADELKKTLKAGHSIVILSSGALPDTVYTPDKNLITPFLQSGGVIFWLGDGFGYYHVAKGQKEVKDEQAYGKIGWPGQIKILGKNYIDGEVFEETGVSAGDDQTLACRALKLRYRYTAKGVTLNDLAKNYAYSLGYNKNINDHFGRSSIAFIPVGKGKLILFGSGILEKQRDVSWDITQIIASNLIFGDSPNLKYEDVSLASGEKKTIKLSLDGQDAQGATVLIFNQNNEIKYFYAKTFESFKPLNSNLST